MMKGLAKIEHTRYWNFYKKYQNKLLYRGVKLYAIKN